MSPKVPVTILGAAVLLTGLLVLTWPAGVISGNDLNNRVECGTGLTGLSDNPRRYDAQIAIEAEKSGVFAGTGSASYQAQCSDKIGIRQAWGWPVGAVGTVIVVCAFLIRFPRRRPGAAHRPPASL